MPAVRPLPIVPMELVPMLRDSFHPCTPFILRDVKIQCKGNDDFLFVMIIIRV